MITVVRYKDIPHAEARCEHMTPRASRDVVLEKWAAIRGTKIAVDLETFRKGDCDQCDSWMLATVPGRCATRSQLEMGD